MKTNTLLLVAVAILGGAILGGFLPHPADAQVNQATPYRWSDKRVWPPAPSQIVNLTDTPTIPGGMGTIYPVYTVPQGKCLVVTDALNFRYTNLIEQHAGVNSTKLLWDASSASGIAGLGNTYVTGLRFRPGSVVSFQRNSASNPSTYPYYLHGYLAIDE